jgi:ATP-binding cassette subfamily F protein 3
LNKYEGSFILVSHDRYFISKAANKIWEIEDHQIKEFKGTYAEWVEWKERMAKQREQKEVKEVKEVAAPVVQQVIEIKPAAPVLNREQKKELQKVQRQFNQLEEKIARLKEEKTKLEAALADPSTYSDKGKFAAAELAYKKNSSSLEELNQEYETLFEKILSMETEMD